MLGYMAWRNSTDNKARVMLAEAMVRAWCRRDCHQQPGTHPDEKAKLEAALPKFQAAADAYPSHDAGLTARYHAAKALVTLGRFDEAVKQYDQVIAGTSPLLARSARRVAEDQGLRPRGLVLQACYDRRVERTLTIRLDEEQDEALTERATALGQTRSALVRAMIAKGLADPTLAQQVGHLKGRVALPAASGAWARRIRQRNWR